MLCWRDVVETLYAELLSRMSSITGMVNTSHQPIISVATSNPASPKRQKQANCPLPFKTPRDIGYPLVMTNSLLLKMLIEIVDLPINSMVFFWSYVNVYQRVVLINGPMQTMVLMMTKAMIFMMMEINTCNLVILTS